MAANGLQQSYACKCLNVRIRSHPAPSPPPATEDSFLPVYVGGDGVSVTHTYVTLRTRSTPVPQGDGATSHLTRYTSLTCLICRTLVYRVHQIASPDVDSAPGPVLPTDDWAEQEVLKSTSGWIEMHRDCLSGDAISQAESSPLYSQTFRIVLPSRDLPSEDATPPRFTAPGSPSLGTHLPALPPLFLPPPFTPAHPVFSYLSQVASEQSQRVRDEAERYLARIVEEKAKEVLAIESRLKNEVEVLWTQFGESIEAAELDGGAKSLALRRRQSSVKKPGSITPTVGAGPSAATASVRIHDFVPAAVPPPKASSRSPSRHVTSALSASLASSSFHYPVTTSAPADTQLTNPNTDNNPRNGEPRSPSLSQSTAVQSPSTSSSRTIAMIGNGDAASIRDAYRRNMDQSLDTATSFRYFALEAQMKEHMPDTVIPEEQQASTSHQPIESISESAVARGRSPRVSKSAIKKPKEHTQSKSPENKAGPSNASNETSPKGKRKVTFVVKPDVAIINRVENSETREQAVESKVEEAVFEMEDETGLREEEEATVQAPAEPAQAPQRPATIRRRNPADILPPSLGSLRPTSLPNISNILSPPLPQDPVQRAAASEVKAAKRSNSNGNIDGGYRPEEPLDPREAEILRLVAASTPSHRAAWKKDSRAWRLFVSRQDHRAHGQSTIEEEDEDTSTAGSPRRYYDDSDDEHEVNGKQSDRQWSYYDTPIASSLPIPINFKSRARQSLGVPSYQPKTSLSDRPGMLVPPLKGSSYALRRASYAERDRTRELDPGALDFSLDDDDDDDENDVVAADPEIGSTGRQRALKIMQARDKMPAAGMWRSLA